jgi:predicted thioesterase
MYSRSILPIGSRTPYCQQVLATPVMILIMENAALNAMRPFLDAGESAVGTAVDVDISLPRL